MVRGRFSSSTSFSLPITHRSFVGIEGMALMPLAIVKKRSLEKTTKKKLEFGQ